MEGFSAVGDCMAVVGEGEVVVVFKGLGGCGRRVMGHYLMQGDVEFLKVINIWFEFEFSIKFINFIVCMSYVDLFKIQ